MRPRSCPSCDRPLPEGQRFCGHCGAGAPDGGADGAASTTETSTSTPDRAGLPAAAALAAAPATATTPDAGGGLTAGSVIAGRYRIVGLLGRGGMGEVYRADDLKLARPVALKFLPEGFERDPARLNRLLNEVRTALSVSHPNVCRVHDVQQEAGRHFITMEYVDGDDLSVLLRRIGRLPADKALQIARQLCAGLGAAHAAGVLHRDLKPANVMIDGRGQVKITDFGLAGLIGGIEGAEIRAGTPAYMSPEQLAGKEVSEASDIYALGLVLYEVYTGKRAFEGTSPAEIARRRESAPTSPSSHITEIDPAVERVILRCLEQDPAQRPTSALAVSAALPGGDPLAAALAAGETPAPELVAEAGAAGGLKPWQAWTLLVAFLVLSTFNILGVERYNAVSRAQLPKSPAVLQEKAREILASLGYDEPPRDSIVEFEFNDDYVAHLLRRGPTPDPWAPLERAQPAAITFGYRQSSGWLRFDNAGAVNEYMTRGILTLPGDVRVRLDPLGRLVWFDAVLPDRLPEGEPGAEPDWTVPLDAAGLDTAALTEVEPVWLPPAGFDRRRAWEGVYPDAPEVAIRVEAAALAGRVVAFRIVEPWTAAREDRALTVTGPDPETGIGAVLGPLLYVLAVVAAAILAWRNVRLGRGDRRTAMRFALGLTALRFAWYLLSHHILSTGEMVYFQSHLAWSLQRFGLAYVFYLAIEPYARKLWPHMLTSWVRLFANRFRDPLVARDLLVGLVLGVGVTAFRWLLSGAATWLEMPAFRPALDAWARESLRGFSAALLGGAGLVTMALLEAFTLVMVIFILRLLVRRDWLTLLPMIAIGIAFGLGQGPAPLTIVFSVVLMTTCWIALFRAGLLSLVVLWVTADATQNLPLTFDLSAWWAAPTWLTLAALLFLAGWGFRMSLAGQPVFRDRVLGILGEGRGA